VNSNQHNTCKVCQFSPSYFPVVTKTEYQYEKYCSNETKIKSPKAIEDKCNRIEKHQENLHQLNSKLSNKNNSANQNIFQQQDDYNNTNKHCKMDMGIENQENRLKLFKKTKDSTFLNSSSCSNSNLNSTLNSNLNIDLKTKLPPVNNIEENNASFYSYVNGYIRYLFDFAWRPSSVNIHNLNDFDNQRSFDGYNFEFQQFLIDSQLKMMQQSHEMEMEANYNCNIRSFYYDKQHFTYN
jgi:hypothetical protein